MAKPRGPGLLRSYRVGIGFFSTVPAGLARLAFAGLAAFRLAGRLASPRHSLLLDRGGADYRP